MEVYELILLAIALSFDTFAVSISCGITRKNIILSESLKFASVLAIFQGIMPVIGWFCGTTIKSFIEPVDHWIAFILLLIIGGKMLKDSLSKEVRNCNSITSNRILITTAFATSIDALSVGIGLAVVKVNMLLAFIIIGLVTFFVSILGMYFGKKIGNLIGQKIGIVGGLILISIGTKILIEHLSV